MDKRPPESAKYYANFMNPFVHFKQSAQYGNSTEHLVNINHIVRITKSANGSQIYTLNGVFFCDSSPDEVELKIGQFFAQKAGFALDN